MDVLLLGLLAVQFGTQPLLNAHYLPRDASKSSVVLASELVKVCAGATLLAAAPDRSDVLRNWSPAKALVRAGVPAVIYSVTNWLIILASRHLPALTLSLLNQTKTLSAALCAYWIVGRTQTPTQVFALMLLVAGAYLVVAADERTAAAMTPSSSSANPALGFAAVCGASLLSGLASALSERALADSRSPTASFIYSLEIAAIGILAVVLSAATGFNREAVSPLAVLGRDMNESWGLLPLVPCTTQALGGLLVGLVTQRAGGVRKGFALIAGLCLTAFLEARLGLRALVPAHLGAVMLVSLSMWLHAWGGRRRAALEEKAKIV